MEGTLHMMWTIPALPRPGDSSVHARPRVNAQHGVYFLAAGQHTQACAVLNCSRGAECMRSGAPALPNPTCL